MMFLKQLFVVTLSTLVILFSGGTQVASHYCNGKVVAKSFNLKVEKCKRDKAVVPFTEHPIASKSSCCDTQISFSKTSSFESIDFQKLIFKHVKPIVVARLAPQINCNVSFIKKSRPPPNGTPIHIWHEKFLI